jgi:hypothetical protein
VKMNGVDEIKRQVSTNKFEFHRFCL